MKKEFKEVEYLIEIFGRDSILDPKLLVNKFLNAWPGSIII
jgi:hypothetical protein